jgi:hypothetical protein
MPVPWIGDPGIQYSPGSNVGPYDAGAIRLDNTTNHQVKANVVVTLPNHAHGDQTFDLWGNVTINAKSSFILTQTAVHRGPQYYETNFDTSDFEAQPAACNALVGHGDAPQVTLTLFNGKGQPTNTATFEDKGRILDTGGYDSVKCGNEALGWSLIGSVSPPQAQEQVALVSTISTGIVQQTNDILTATVTDASGQPLQNVTVDFEVLNGPDQGTLGSAVTNGSGQATETYTGQATGNDTIRAFVNNASGGHFVSNAVHVRWRRNHR